MNPLPSGNVYRDRSSRDGPTATFLGPFSQLDSSRLDATLCTNGQPVFRAVSLQTPSTSPKTGEEKSKAKGTVAESDIENHEVLN